MKVLYKVVAGVFISLMLAGCAGTMNKMDKYGSSPVAEAALVPHEELLRPAHVLAPYDSDFDTEVLPFARPGMIVISHDRKKLLLVTSEGYGRFYPVAVGNEGFGIAGTAYVGEMKIDPTWTPPAEMIARKPHLAKWAGGMPGGVPENPLGSRAIYLHTSEGDTMYRIHGTNDRNSIGTNASSGCIRMLNEDVEDLYARIGEDTPVIVLGPGNEFIGHELEAMMSPEAEDESGAEYAQAVMMGEE